MIRHIHERRAELREHQDQLRDRISELETQTLPTPHSALIDALPTGYIEVGQLPEPLARTLFEALCLEIRYNATTARGSAVPIFDVPPARRVQDLHVTVPAVNCGFPPPLTSFGVVVVPAVHDERRADRHRVDRVAGRWVGLRGVRS